MRSTGASRSSSRLLLLLLVGSAAAFLLPPSPPPSHHHHPAPAAAALARATRGSQPAAMGNRLPITAAGAAATGNDDGGGGGGGKEETEEERLKLDAEARQRMAEHVKRVEAAQYVFLFCSSVCVLWFTSLVFVNLCVGLGVREFDWVFRPVEPLWRSRAASNPRPDACCFNLSRIL